MTVSTAIRRTVIPIVVILAMASAATPSSRTRLMIQIEPTPGLGPTDGHVLVNYLAEQLTRAGYEVSIGGKSGDVDFILSGPLEIQAGGQRTLYGMTMRDVSAVFTYRVTRAGTGRLHFSDTRTAITRAKSVADARHQAILRAGDRVVRAISERIPTSLTPEPPPPPPPPPPPEDPEPPPEPEPSGPRIVMINPPDARTVQRIEQAGFTIEGRAMAPEGIQSVTVNGRPARLTSDGGFTFPVRLRQGDNRFEIKATSKRGRAARRTIVIPGRAADPDDPSPGFRIHLWGLVVGVSRYADPGLSLRFADKDAVAIKRVLEAQAGKLYQEVHIRSLVNEEVTRDAIIEGISSHLGRAAPNDVVFIFVAGHGIQHRQTGSYYFVPHDATLETLLSRGLRTTDFKESINILSRNVERIVIMMDTCHSGAMDAKSRALPPGSNLAEIMKFSKGLFILSGSRDGELSYEDERYRISDGDTGHGAFTLALLEGMTGAANHDRDDHISLNELFHYVSRRVPRLTDGRQHPYFRLHGTDMPFLWIDSEAANGR